MKIFFFLIMLLIISCSDNKIIAPDDIIDKKEEEFPFLSNISQWELENSDSEMIIESQDESIENWAFDFWNQDSIVSLKTIVLKVKYFKEKLPVRIKYAIGKSDSGLYFGTNFPSIPKLFAEDSIYYSSFFLPVSSTDTIIRKEHIIDYGSFVFEYVNETAIKDTTILFNDSLYNCYHINHLREQKEFDEVLKSGENFIINKKIGFLWFWNYKTEKINNKI